MAISACWWNPYLTRCLIYFLCISIISLCFVHFRISVSHRTTANTREYFAENMFLIFSFENKLFLNHHRYYIRDIYSIIQFTGSYNWGFVWHYLRHFAIWQLYNFPPQMFASFHIHLSISYLSVQTPLDRKKQFTPVIRQFLWIDSPWSKIVSSCVLRLIWANLFNLFKFHSIYIEVGAERRHLTFPSFDPQIIGQSLILCCLYCTLVLIYSLSFIWQHYRQILRRLHKIDCVITSCVTIFHVLSFSFLRFPVFSSLNISFFLNITNNVFLL